LAVRENHPFCLSRSRITFFLFSDDHALQAISAYGGRFKDLAPTPCIDRLAKQGAIFERSYCANSICGPSRACILTGKHSHKNGFTGNENCRFECYKLFFLPQSNEWQLFDLEKDPQELTSIHDDAASAGVLADMKTLYQQLRRQYEVK